MAKINILLIMLLTSLNLVGCRTIDFGLRQRNSENDHLLPVSSCLYYLSLETDREGIQRACVGEASETILAEKDIQEYSITRDGNEIAYIQDLQDGGSVIKMYAIDKKSDKEIISCDASRCENISIHPDGSTIFYSRTGSTTGFFQFEIDNESEELISSSFADWVDISPEGGFLRFHEADSGLIRILDLDDLTLVLSYKGDVDLVGSWSSDGKRFLMGERNVDGQLLISNYSEIYVEKNEKEQLFTLPQGSAFFNPVYFREDNYFVQSRAGVRNNSREVQVIDKEGNVVDTITDRNEFDHSSLQWNPNVRILAYQRKDITRSDSMPEIMIWDFETRTTSIVSANAVQPQWHH